MFILVNIQSLSTLNRIDMYISVRNTKFSLKFVILCYTHTINFQ